MSKQYRPYEPDQRLLLPPNLDEWLPEDHMARFVRDVRVRADQGARIPAIPPEGGTQGARRVEFDLHDPQRAEAIRQDGRALDQKLSSNPETTRKLCALRVSVVITRTGS
jgi:hypothetical protein